MSWLGILSLVPFALLLLAVMIIIVLDAAGGDYGKRKVEEMFSSVYKLFHRPSPLQREIMQEEKEIKQLEAQKADIRRLEELRRKRESLFEEVGDKHVERVEERLTSHIAEPDGMTHQNTYFCHRCEKNKTLNLMSKENSIILICKKCEEEMRL